MNKHILILSFSLMISLIMVHNSCETSTEPEDKEETVILNHTKTTLSLLSSQDIENAKSKLHIAYGHTSHGSQIVTGMEGLVSFKGELYSFNEGGTEGSLDLRDKPFSGASDLGNPDRTAWATATRNYLENNPDINVIIWSWCGQVSTATEEDIDTYLTLMAELEADYPEVKFVYMTGHLDGTGEEGNLHLRNEQIRQYCKENKKLLYDFADIESFAPGSNTNYMVLNANDGCYYDSDGDGSQDANWAIDWQNSHTEDEDWYDCSSAHSQPLNANLKAYAAWYLWVSIARL